MKNLFATASIIAILAGSGSARAQAVRPSAQPETTQSSVGIADIIVTASRREETLQKTAIPVTAVTSAELEARGVANVTDITKLVPAVKIGSLAGSGVQVTIRGVGSFGGNSYAEPGVPFILDGVYLARSPGASGIFYDVKRVEVLKGPQGTLYGRNSTGGVVNIITNDPSNERSMDFTGEYGNYQHVRATAGVTIPLIDGILSVRAAGQVVSSDGITRDGVLSEDSKAGRIKIKFTPTSRLSLLLEADYSKSKDGPVGGGFIIPGYDPFHDIASGPNSLQNLPILGANEALKAAAGIPAAAPVQLLPLIKDSGFNDNSSRGFQGTLNYDFGPFSATAIVANRQNIAYYQHYGAGFPVSDDNRDSPSNSTTAELRLASVGSSRLKWQIGGFYFNDDNHSRLSFDQGVVFQLSDVHIRTKSYSGFGEGTYSITDRVRFTAGGRYTSDRKSLDGFTVNPVGGPLAPPLPLPLITNILCPVSQPGVAYSPVPTVDPATGNPFFSGSCTLPATGKQTFNKFTWKLGVEADIAPQSLVYATVATGFKSGGFDITADSPALRNFYKPETLTAYTIGSKNRFFSNMLQINAEAFYWNYKDKQVTHIGPGVPSGNILRVDNAGGAKIYGAEIEAVFKPTTHDMFTANVQYLHTKYNDFQYTVAYFAGGNPLVGPNVNCQVQNITVQDPTFNTGRVDCSGRRVAFSPTWTLNVGYNHEFDLGSKGTLVAAVNTQIQSSFYLGEEYLGDELQGSSTVTDAQLTWQDKDHNLSISGYINNIENSVIGGSSFVYPFAAPGGGTRIAPRPPRAYGVRMNVHF